MIFRILEISWLIIGLLAVGMSIFIIITKGVTSEIILFLVIAFVSGIIYSIRRKQRLAMDRKQKKE